jgi:hypothetical protein
MRILNTKKTKYEQVAEILDKQGYILDDQTAKIFGNDKIYAVSEHIRIWKKLKSDREFFALVKIVEKKKGYRSHLVRLEGQNHYYKVGKEFYNTVVI